MTDAFRRILAALSILPYDDLTDLLEALALSDDRPRERQHQKKAGEIDNSLRSVEAWAVWWLIAVLSDDDRQAIQRVIAAMQAVLATQERRKQTSTGDPQARGTVLTKAIARKWLNLETGELETRRYGPYVYIHLRVTGGDKGDRTSRFRSIYIPQSHGLALAFLAGGVSADAILDAYHAGTIAELCARRP